MKRYGNLYEKIYSMENLKLAHKNARKGKSWYKEVKMVDENPEYYLGLLQQQLINKTYKTSEYEVFIKKDSGKEREIYKLPYFPDRICQWAILQVIEPILVKNLTEDTYSAITNRGIHRGLNRVKNDMKADPDGCKYCLKFDAKKYYPSIDHDILKQKYARLFKDKDLLWLINEIIDSTEGNVGIPIGNYLSQFSGNLYLSSFDHWIKEEKYVKHYHRYMDDIVIFGNDKKQLHDLKKEIDEYFDKQLHLKIKENWQVFPTSIRGVDFLGYRIFPNYVLLRKSTCKNMKNKLNAISKKIDCTNSISHSDCCSVNSYSGWLDYCDSYRLNKKYIKHLTPFVKDFYNQKKGRKSNEELR